MEGDIQPVFLNSKIPIVSILQSQAKVDFILIDILGGVSFCKLIEDKLMLNNHDKIRFDVPCKEYKSDINSQYIIGFGTRDFHVIDLKNNKNHKITVSHDGNESIFKSYFIPNKSQFVVCLDHTAFSDEESYEVTMVYDIDRNQIINYSEKYNGSIIFPLNESTVIREEFKILPNSTVWQICDPYIKNKLSNKLTDTLSKMNLGVWEYSWSPKTNIMIGFDDVNYLLYSVCWDSVYKDVTVEPWTFQKSEKYFYNEHFQFSQDGRWIRGTVSPRDTNDIDLIAFYNVDQKYPSKVSIPIIGGETQPNSRGIFIDTPEYGTVYLDISDGLDGIIYMYKMSDVLKQIVKKSAEMVK